MQEHVIEQYPDTDLSVQFIWVRAFEDDDASVATELAASMDDPRVRHYWDRPLLVAGSLSEHLFPDYNLPFAWDVYLFFEPDAVWGAEPPMPLDWFHLMARMAVDNYCPPDDAGPRVDELMERLVPSGSAPIAGP